ncbi:MAG: glycosyl hydrolase 115 family protein, partial [Clostridia bacterium]|nr:glycosyl hydrolase 115 family protein [Clostridia bacterium]
MISILLAVLLSCGDGEVSTLDETTTLPNNADDTLVEAMPGDFDLFANSNLGILAEGIADPDATQGEWPGVVRAANDLKQDIIDVCSLDPSVVSDRSQLVGKTAIIIGSLDKGTTVQNLAKAGKIDISDVEGKWESYRLEVVSDPFDDGTIDVALVIFGSDKRGTIYGIYELSAMLGVSPLKYFADSSADPKTSFVLKNDYVFFSDEPSVKYRGIFLNDEEQLEYWARQLDGDLNMGPNVYLKIFEMLLRLKSNYLWPAMHVCVEAFNAFPENPKNADYYGIVIGTSHCDMLLRNNLNEWDSFKAAYRAETGYTGTISYDYTVCPEIVLEYWRRSVRANKDYEVQWTLGMRGAHDEGFTAVNLNQAPWYGDSTKLLEEIIEAQRQILREELDNPTLEGVFQVFIPYKEVQAIYNQGLELPDDVMVMWADDNHGFIRDLPNATERERSGGHGVYYHNSYWGPDDESYMWLNTMPLTLFYEEMSKAIRYGADTAWIINVGDIKPGEISMEFLLDYAFHADEYTDETVYAFIEKWAKREFPDADIEMIVSIEKRLCQYTNARKLEHMKVDLFTNVHFNDEFEKRLSAYKTLLDDAEAVYASLKDSKKATFYETVLYQVRSAYYSNAEFFYATKANFAVEMGKSTTAYNCTIQSQWYNELKKYETAYFNKVLMDGKWDGILSPEEYSPPVSPGYAQSSPAISLVQKDGGIIVEDEYAESENPTLVFYNYSAGRKFIDVFSKGIDAFDFEVVSCPEFVVLSVKKGTVLDEVRIWASVDFSKLPKSSEGDIVFSYCDGKTKTVHIQAIVETVSVGEKTYIEQDGYVSIEAEHYSKSYATDTAYFTTIKDLGRVSGDMIRANSLSLTGIDPDKILRESPYVEYSVYFFSSGDFTAEVYRLPTLSARGKVRFAVQIDNGEPIILSGESDYGVGNYAWEEGVFNQIIKHKLTVSIPSAGEHTVRLYMVDPELCFDKIVIYTDGFKPSYFGPDESYNTTFNPKPDSKYEAVYETKFLPVHPMQLTDTFGTGYFVEDGGQIRIETASAIEQ